MTVLYNKNLTTCITKRRGTAHAVRLIYGTVDHGTLWNLPLPVGVVNKVCIGDHLFALGVK